MLFTDICHKYNTENEQHYYNRKIRRVAFIYLSLSSNTDKRRVLEEKFMLRPKLGFGYLRAALAEIGIESKIYDQVLTSFDSGKLAGLLQNGEIDLTGFYIVSENLKVALNFIKDIKEKTNSLVIAGGPGCYHYNELIDAGCEIVCLGEGDKTIIDIVDYYNGTKARSEIMGISYRDTITKEIFITSERPQVDNLDNLSFPVRDPATIMRYCHYFAYPLKKPHISIMASRGCPHNCAFCTSYSFWKKKYRQRSPENVIQEIKQAVSEYRIKSIQFVDDIFALRFDWLKEFCQAFKREKFNLNWMCNLHPMSFRLVREKAFSIMRESGCNIISFGAQSADSEILRGINRDPDEPEELRKAIYQAKSLGITTVLTYILGLPGETPETMQKNFNFCLETKPHLVDFHPLDIIPFSELDSRCKEKKIFEAHHNEANRVSTRYMVKYYTNPMVACQLLKDILCKNPFWIFTF